MITAYHPDAEMSVLGAIIAVSDSYYQVPFLKPEHFYDERHKAMFNAIVQMQNASKKVDLVTLHQHLLATGQLEAVGGASYVVEVTNRIMSFHHIVEHANIVREYALRRDLRQLGVDIVAQAEQNTTDTIALAEAAEKGLYAITQSNLVTGAKTTADVMAESLRTLDLAKANKGQTGTPSGFAVVDAVTGGWQPSDLIILAARPAQGKTALAINYALNAAQQGFPVAVFSLEMSAKQLGDRMISAVAMVQNDAIRTGRVSDYETQKVIQAAEIISTLPIYIDDSASLSITELKSKCRKLSAEKGVKLIIVDYLQLMSGNRNSRDNREVEVSSISRGLKMIAKETNVPVLALSQLSRQTEQRGGSKRPQLSDLRESGAIEQDADIVTFIHRPEYYGITEDENGRSTAGKAEIIFAKHRNGKVGIENLQFASQYTLFQNDTQYDSTPF